MKNRGSGKGRYILGCVIGAAVCAACIGFMLPFGGALFVIGLIAAAAALVTLTYCAVKLQTNKKEEYTTAKYVRKKSYITPCEFDFLIMLRKIDSSRYEVLPQCALLSVIDKVTETSYRNELFRIVDYVFVDAVTFAPLLLVELNDRSHLRADRKMRDEKVNEICSKAKLPLVTFTTAQIDDYAFVKKTVLANILKR